MTDEEENVWRALQDKDLLVSRKCWWGWHRWTKWRETKRGVGTGPWGGYNSHVHITLEKKCIGCGLPYVKLVRYKVDY